MSFARSFILKMALALTLLAGLLLATSAHAEEVLPDPNELGPYPVGVTTLTVVDHSRIDPATKGPRTLLTEIWYPASEESRELPRNKLSDFLLRGAHSGLNVAVRLAFGADASSLDDSFSNFAVRDARVRDGKFPLIVFSHGNGGLRNQSSFWCDHMASHGYIVMSADHPGNARVTVVDGKLVLYNPEGWDYAETARPQDVSFLIDRMTAFNRGEDSRFAGRVDLDHIGVAGHSFGGFTAIAVANEDPRVDAILPMTPVLPERKNYDIPVLLLLATEDGTIGVKGNEKARLYFDESKGPHYLVEMVDGGHFSPTDMFQIDPEYGNGIGSGVRVTRPGEPVDFLGMEETYRIINGYSAAFFGLYVKDEPGYAPFLESNAYGEALIVKAILPELPGVATAAASPARPAPAQPGTSVDPPSVEKSSATRSVSVLGEAAPVAVIAP